MANEVQTSKDPSVGLGDMSGAMRSILGKFLRSSIDDMLPAKIIAYDRTKNRATVEPLIAMIKTDGNNVIRNQVASVPVMNFGGGGFVLSFNLNPGDLGWIKASDRDISNFLKSYKQSSPNTFRAHDFSDSVFIPDVMTGYTIDGEDQENAVLQTLDGSVRVSLFPAKLKLTAPTIELDTPSATFTGDVQIDGAATLGSGGGQPIARQGDAVSGGVITGGSGTHTAT